MLERRGRGAFRASAWVVRCALGCPPAIPAVPGVRTVPGAASHALQHLTHYTVHLRPGDPGHLFPPFLLQAQQECPAQQAQSDMVMPAGPGARLVFVQSPRRSSRSRIRFQCATATRPRKPACPRVCPPGRWTGTGALDRYRGVGQVPGRWTGTGALDRYRGVGQVVAGFAPVHVFGGKWPRAPRRASASWLPGSWLPGPAGR